MTEQTDTKHGFKVRLFYLFLFAALFFIILFSVAAGLTYSFDESLLLGFYSIRNEALTVGFSAFTFLGNTYTVVVICVILLVLPWRMRVGLPVTLMVVAGWLIQTLVKTVVARPRPCPLRWLIDMPLSEYFQSFPSGHSNISFILWIALAVLIGRLLLSKNRRGLAAVLRVVFIIVAVLIALSRPYLGVHYPTDVFGGWALACLILTVGFFLYDKYWPISPLKNHD